MEVIVREILAELAAPPVLVFPEWDDVADGFRPFQVYCDVCIGGFGAALEQEQPDGSVRPVAYISRATLDSERHWTPLDLEAGSIVWSIKRLRGYLWGTKFRIFSDHKALESIGKVGDHNARIRKWLEFLTAFDCTLEYRRGSVNGNADFLSRLPEPATERDLARGRLRYLPHPGLWASHPCLSNPRCLFEWASAPLRERCIGWAPFRRFGFSRFSHTRATYED